MNIMNNLIVDEEFITLETAILAKERGLNFSTNRKVYNDRGYICEVDYDLSHLEEDIPYITQSLLTKWIRKKYSIHIFHNLHIDTDGRYYSYKVIEEINNTPKEIYSIDLEGPFEKSMEVVLQKVLNLIKK